jgi:hypothetical protein
MPLNRTAQPSTTSTRCCQYTDLMTEQPTPVTTGRGLILKYTHMLGF